MILALLAWKRPRLALKLGAGWLATLSVCAVIAAPCRLYLRALGAPVQFDARPVYDVLGFFAGLLILAGMAVLAIERRERRMS